MPPSFSSWTTCRSPWMTTASSVISTVTSSFDRPGSSADTIKLPSRYPTSTGGIHRALAPSVRLVEFDPGWANARFISCCSLLSTVKGESSKKPRGSSNREGTEGRIFCRAREVCWLFRSCREVVCEEVVCEEDGCLVCSAVCADIICLHIWRFLIAG